MDDRQDLASLLCVAQEVETRGVALYARLKNAVSDSFVREVFVRLEKAERQHMLAVEGMSRNAEAYPLVCGDLDSQRRSWPELFRDMTEIRNLKAGLGAEDVSLVIKALTEAQDFEMEAIRFYESWLSGKSGGIGCDLCGRLIEEEKSHFVLLDEMIDYFSATTEE